jgi:hypothetical protein
MGQAVGGRGTERTAPDGLLESGIPGVFSLTPASWSALGFGAHLRAYAEHDGPSAIPSEDFQHDPLYPTVRLVIPVQWLGIGLCPHACDIVITSDALVGCRGRSDAL